MNWFRKAGSYLFGVIIEKRNSAVSGELEVWFQNGRYVLHSPFANYSFDTLHRVFQEVFASTGIKEKNPQNVLVLGFGAGSVASILCDELNLAPEITGIELDSEVIALAKKYFNIGRFKKLKLYQGDAVTFAIETTQQFDLIISDVFIDKRVPEKFLSEKYIQRLVNLTAPNGMGFFNIIAEGSHQKNDFARLETIFINEGARVEILSPSSINKMIVWRKA